MTFSSIFFNQAYFSSCFLYHLLSEMGLHRKAPAVTVNWELADVLSTCLQSHKPHNSLNVSQIIVLILSLCPLTKEASQVQNCEENEKLWTWRCMFASEAATCSWINLLTCGMKVFLGWFQGGNSIWHVAIQSLISLCRVLPLEFFPQMRCW